jgi:preprotein translocase subunit SecE
VADTAETKKRTGPFTFLAQVRTEARKVTWTTRNETVAATVMVLIMVLAAALFFLVTDAVVVFLVRLITQVGSLNG